MLLGTSTIFGKMGTCTVGKHNTTKTPFSHRETRKAKPWINLSILCLLTSPLQGMALEIDTFLMHFSILVHHTIHLELVGN